MIWVIFILAQLGFSSVDGGTPHSVTLVWPAVIVTYQNDDGTTATRPALSYYVQRAPVVNGVPGTFTILNPDDMVITMIEDDGTVDPGSYEDSTVAQGSSYVYAVTAVDSGGESSPSPLSGLVTIPLNPNYPPNFKVVFP